MSITLLDCRVIHVQKRGNKTIAERITKSTNLQNFHPQYWLYPLTVILNWIWKIVWKNYKESIKLNIKFYLSAEEPLCGWKKKLEQLLWRIKRRRNKKWHVETKTIWSWREFRELFGLDLIGIYFGKLYFVKWLNILSQSAVI